MPPPLPKRRKIAPAIEEITFDPAARQDYLSGFHKRKQQRIRHAKDDAVKRDRDTKLEARKQIREQRRMDLEKHVEAVNSMLRSGEEGESDELEMEVAEARGLWRVGGLERVGVDDGRLPEHEEEYVDEDRFTTVTVEPLKMDGDEEDAGSEGEGDITGAAREGTGKVGVKSGRASGIRHGKGPWTKEKPDKNKPKKKKKKFRYESKVERKMTRTAQKSKNSAAAKARKMAARGE